MKKKRAHQILGATPVVTRGTTLAALMVTGLLLTGCGQKGPLMLPTASSVKAGASDANSTPAVRNNNDQVAPR